MTGLRRWGLALFLTALSTAAVRQLHLATLAPAKHIFVNESPDHHFDESVRLSILSAYARTGVQNAVVISDRFDAQVFETEAAKLYARLNLGRNTNGRAILYLYSPQQQALKIEIGYALESKLPDGLTHFLESAAKSYAFAYRMEDFWAELINTLNIEIHEHETGDRQPFEFDFAKHRFLSGGGGVSKRDYQLSEERRDQERRLASVEDHQRFQASTDLNETLRNYRESLKFGFGDSDLPLLNSHSRRFREKTPLTSYQQFRNWRMMEKAGVDRIFVSDNLAFVFFRPGQPVLPIVLTKEGDKYFVDEPLSWALFQRFEDSMHVFAKYPMAFSNGDLSRYLTVVLGRPIYKGPVVDPLNLARPDSNLKRLLWREFAPRDVSTEFELRPLDQHTDDDLWIGLDAYMAQGRLSAFVHTYEEVVRRRPADAEIKRNAQFYREISIFSAPEWQLAL